MQPLTISYLKSVFNVVGYRLFKDVGDEVTPAQVREFMLEHLDGEPPQNHVVTKMWKPLTPAQKNEWLLKAFPDGQSYRLPTPDDFDEEEDE